VVGLIHLTLAGPKNGLRLTNMAVNMIFKYL
jgi:hypothetical protein